MPLEETVAQWITGLRAGDEDAARGLWVRYCGRLVALARGRLPSSARRESDEEDVALSAFHSFCRGVQRGRFPDLTDDSGLWPLLMVITARKSLHHLRAHNAMKRGGGHLRGESAIRRGDGEEDEAAVNRIIGSEPTPEYAAEVAEQAENLLACLEDPSLQRLALLKLEGHRNDEIATISGCARRTVERRLGLIRRIWAEHPGIGDRTT